MSREKRTATTDKYGDVEILVALCDLCGVETPHAESTYYPPEDWYMIRQSERSSNGTREFCSVGCMIAAYAPGYFDVDPDQVKRALQGLEKIEVDLGGPKETAVPW